LGGIPHKEEHPVSTSHAPEPVAVKASTAALMLDCTRQHVYKLIERGELRRCQIGGTSSVRIPVSDIYRVLGLEAPDGAA
jgi:excisionase family DNA binding protein